MPNPFPFSAVHLCKIHPFTPYCPCWGKCIFYFFLTSISAILLIYMNNLMVFFSSKETLRVWLYINIACLNKLRWSLWVKYLLFRLLVHFLVLAKQKSQVIYSMKKKKQFNQKIFRRFMSFTFTLENENFKIRKCFYAKLKLINRICCKFVVIYQIMNMWLLNTC